MEQCGGFVSMSRTNLWIISTVKKRLTVDITNNVEVK